MKRTIMRVNISMIIASLLIFGLSFSSCGEDDKIEEEMAKAESDYSLPASGSISVSNSDGSTSYIREVQDAGYRAWSTAPEDPATLWLRATFKEENPVSVESFWANHKKINMIFIEVSNFQKLEIGDIIYRGTVRTRYCVYEKKGIADIYDTFDQTGLFSGKVRISHFVLNQYITLEFSNCGFSASSTSLSPSPAPTKGTFSGEISFPLRQKTFFN